MTVKTIECVVCGESVPYGRLSCPACGALLASVSGGSRAAIRPVAAGVAAVAKASPAVAVAEVAVQAHVRSRPRTSSKRHRNADAGNADAGTVGSGIGASEAAAELAVELAVKPIPAPVQLTIEAAVVPAAARQATILPAAANPAALDPVAGAPFVGLLPEAVLDRAFAPLAARPYVGDAPAATPSATTWPPLHLPGPVLAARPYQRHLATESDVPAEPTLQPGAYRRSSMAPAAAPAMAEGAVAAYAGRLAVAVGATAGHADNPGDARGAVDSIKGLVERAMLVEIAGWFVIVGATMSVLGFLLPWSITVIGSSGFGGYFNGWGLASPTHVLVFGGLLATLALGVLRTEVPAWLRSGVLGLALGGLLIGLAWPYLVGRLGADVGVIVTALGGLALAIGGAVASWATRHAEPEPLV